MKILSRFILPLVVLFSNSTLSAGAQTRTLTARILCLRNHDGIETVRFGTSPEDLGPKQQLLIGDYSLPFRIKIVDDTVCAFHDLASPGTAPMATVKIPPTTSNVTLLFLPGDTEGYRIVAMPDSAEAFKKDTIRFLNLSALTVQYRLENLNMELAPGKMETLTSLPERDRFNMSNVAVASRAGDAWKLVSQTQWHFVTGDRHLIISYVLPGTRRLVSISYKDRPGAEQVTRPKDIP